MSRSKSTRGKRGPDASIEAHQATSSITGSSGTSSSKQHRREAAHEQAAHQSSVSSCSPSPVGQPSPSTAGPAPLASGAPSLAMHPSSCSAGSSSSMSSPELSSPLQVYCRSVSARERQGVFTIDSPGFGVLKKGTITNPQHEHVVLPDESSAPPSGVVRQVPATLVECVNAVNSFVINGSRALRRLLRVVMHRIWQEEGQRTVKLADLSYHQVCDEDRLMQLVSGLDISIVPHHPPGTAMFSRLVPRTVHIHHDILSRLHRQPAFSPIKALVMMKLIHALFLHFTPTLMTHLYGLIHQQTPDTNTPKKIHMHRCTNRQVVGEIGAYAETTLCRYSLIIRKGRSYLNAMSLLGEEYVSVGTKSCFWSLNDEAIAKLQPECFTDPNCLPSSFFLAESRDVHPYVECGGDVAPYYPSPEELAAYSSRPEDKE